MKYICEIKRSGEGFEACGEAFDDFVVLLLHVRDKHCRSEEKRFRIADHYLDLELERISTQIEN